MVMGKDVNQTTITSALAKHHKCLEGQFVSALDGIETTVAALKSEAAFACTSKRLREAVEHADAVLVQALSHIVEDGDDTVAVTEMARDEFNTDAFEEPDQTEPEGDMSDDDAQSVPAASDGVDDTDTDAGEGTEVSEPSAGSDGLGETEVPANSVLPHDNESDFAQPEIPTQTSAPVEEQQEPTGDAAPETDYQTVSDGDGAESDTDSTDDTDATDGDDMGEGASEDASSYEEYYSDELRQMPMSFDM